MEEDTTDEALEKERKEERWLRRRKKNFLEGPGMFEKKRKKEKKKNFLTVGSPSSMLNTQASGVLEVPEAGMSRRSVLDTTLATRKNSLERGLSLAMSRRATVFSMVFVEEEIFY